MNKNKVSTIILDGLSVGQYSNIEKFLQAESMDNQDLIEIISSSSQSAVQERSICGITEYIVVVQDSKWDNGLISFGRNITIRRLTVTPNNRGCLAIGDIIYNVTFENTMQAQMAFNVLVQDLKKGK